jgi:hypothetical protein
MPLLGSQLGIEEETGHADHRVQGGANLVAHRCEERALGFGRRFGVPPRLLEIPDVVIQAVEADGLSPHDDRCSEQLDVHQAAILPCPPRDGVDEVAPQALLGIGLGLRTDLIAGGDQIVDVATDRLLGRETEQSLGGGVPRGDRAGSVHQYDRIGAPLHEGLVVALLSLDLTDVVVDHAVTDALAADQHGRRKQLHVHQRAVLAGPTRDHPELLARDALGAVAGGFLVELGGLRDEVVEVGADRLLGAVAEQSLGAGVPRGDLGVLVDGDDRGGTELEDGFEPSLLLLDPGDVVIDDIVADLLSARRHRRDEEFDVEQRPVAPGPLGQRLHQLAP